MATDRALLWIASVVLAPRERTVRRVFRANLVPRVPRATRVCRALRVRRVIRVCPVRRVRRATRAIVAVRVRRASRVCRVLRVRRVTRDSIAGMQMAITNATWRLKMRMVTDLALSGIASVPRVLRDPRATLVTTGCLARRERMDLLGATARLDLRVRRVTTARRVPQATLVAMATTAGI